MEQNLAVIHEELLLLLKKFHELCLEHDIKYSLHGGSLLGAVREKGFIPWDDDADFSLTRSEFERLRKVLRETDLGPEFRYDENNRFDKFIMKRPGKPPVWADIFIYDYISTNPLARKLKLQSNYFFLLFTRTKERQRLSNIHGVYKGVKKFAMNAIVTFASLFPMTFRMKLAKRNLQSFPGNKTVIHRANDQAHGIHRSLPKEVMDEYKVVPFENIEVMISAGYDAILVSCFGKDYMTPRKEKTEDVHAMSLQEEQDKYIKEFFCEETDG